MFRKLALGLVLSCALVAPSNSQCGPFTAWVGYWTTKAAVYTAAVVTVIIRPETIVVVNPANTAMAAEGAGTTVAAVLAVLPLP